jgi:hypothetical protein
MNRYSQRSILISFLSGLAAGTLAVGVVFIFGGFYVLWPASQTLFSITMGEFESQVFENFGLLAKQTVFIGFIVTNIMVYGVLGVFIDKISQRLTLVRYLHRVLMSLVLCYTLFLIIALIFITVVQSGNARQFPTVALLVISLIPPQLTFALIFSSFLKTMKKRSQDEFQPSLDKSSKSIDIDYGRRDFLRLAASSSIALPIIFLGLNRLFSGQNDGQESSSSLPDSLPQAGPILIEFKNAKLEISTDPSIEKDGVAFIYPTATSIPNPFVWYMNPNNPEDGWLNKGGGSNFSNLIKNPDGSWRADNNVDVKFNIIVNRNEAGGKPDAIGGCNMNFQDCINRGYTHAANDIGRKGVEMTGFFKVYGPLGHHGHYPIGGIFMRGPWNHHPGKSGGNEGSCCQEAMYDVVVETDGKINFTKESSKNDVYTNPGGPQRIPSFNMIGHGFFGLKYIFLNETTNKVDPKIKLQLYFNRNGDGLSWIKYGEVVDNRTTYWGPRRARCGGKKYQVYAWGAPGMVIKFYTSRVDFKKWSIREVTPRIGLYINESVAI